MLLLAVGGSTVAEPVSLKGCILETLIELEQQEIWLRLNHHCDSLNRCISLLVRSYLAWRALWACIFELLPKVMEHIHEGRWESMR